MFAYRERRLASPGSLPGAARVQFPTAGSAEFKSRPRDGRGGRICDCPTGPSGRNEEQADAGQHIKTGTKNAPLVSPFHARP
jgi:hypothetical protein